MAHRIFKLMGIIGYILTPEVSPKLDQEYNGSENQASSKNCLVEYVKTAVWILLSIMLSLALGQLN